MAKIHTTNYFNTFIEVAEDCKTDISLIPPLKGDKKSIANWQFELLQQKPLTYSSDELLFEIFAIRNELTDSELAQAKSDFFSKGQACLRASPLTKTYGWGIFFNSDGKISLVPQESERYQQLLMDNSVQKVKAMRSSKK